MSTLKALFVATISVTSGRSMAAGAADPLRAMSGMWDVQQRTWLGPKEEAKTLPAATAERRIVHDGFVEETMQATGANAFTRHALLNYNPVTNQFEYVSIDTRAPQLMIERSAANAAFQPPTDLSLKGGIFLAPEWGTMKNLHFTYRLTISPVSDGKQTVRLFLTPMEKLGKAEFLAFEYVYTKRSGQ